MKVILVTAALVMAGMIAVSLAGCSATGKILGPASDSVYDKKAERTRSDWGI
jgi:hypothetical protein